LSDPQYLSRVDDDFATEYPGADAVASECFVNLVRVADRVESELSRRLRHEAKLSTTSLMVLATVDGLGGQTTPSVIGKHVPITSAAVTSLLDTNEKRGLVERTPDPVDRRKVQILLTDKGRTLIDRLLPGVHQLETRVMQALTSSEQKQLLELLEKVHGAVARAATEPPTLADSPRIRTELVNLSGLERPTDDQD
jgi:MarR family transcriptional regulator, 2-MHQ and catechol-resistance regulon repressor